MRDRRFPALVLAALLGAGCSRAGEGAGSPVAGGEVELGKRLLRGYDCGGCHVIPGVPASVATVGPPLSDWAGRKTIAGALPNTPENLVAFLMTPQRFQPGGGMPALGVSAQDARHMAAYLFTLGDPAPQDLGPWHPFRSESLRELASP